jgi:hypothetical protein
VTRRPVGLVGWLGWLVGVLVLVVLGSVCVWLVVTLWRAIL